MMMMMMIIIIIMIIITTFLRKTPILSRAHSALQLYIQHLQYTMLVSWCFKTSQPQRIILGLRETFIKRYIVERTHKAEMRPGEQSEDEENRLRKWRVVGRIYGMKYS